MSDTGAGGKNQESEFSDTPAGWASRWAMEFEAARKELAEYHKRGAQVIERYLDKDKAPSGPSRGKRRRLNLFTSNTQTLEAILYGRVPKVSVSRKFADAHDAPARVAGEMLERICNTDIESDSDTYAVALTQALEDRLLPGMGNVRLRYEVEHEEVPGREAILDEQTGQERAPAVPATQRISYECVEVDYVHWKDQLWNPARVFTEVRWWAFRNEMGREEIAKKWGDGVAKLLPLNSKRGAATSSADAQNADPWARCDVWEIWDKDSRCVWFFVEGYSQVLGAPIDVDGNENGSVPDPFGLESFFPFPRPMAANTTTSGFVPQSDFVVAQDLYNEIDDYSTRIYLLQKAIKVAGVYNKSSEEVKRLVSESSDNELIPVDNWAMFAEKGGIAGNIAWLPLEMIVTALDKLRELRQESIQLLFQVTGFSDIMRGQATQQATATEQSIKAKFASVRIQRLQDEFARFASDVQRIKVEIMAKHFSPETLIQQSNIMATPDAALAQQAVQLIQSGFAQYRIEVKPENISLTDYAALRSERTDFVTGLAQFFQAAQPVMQAMPGGMPFLLGLLQWYVTGFKGSSEIQGLVDQAIAQAEQQQAQQAAQPPAPPPPDPRVISQQMKQQHEAQMSQVGLQVDLAKIHAQTQADVARRQAESTIDLKEEIAKASLHSPLVPPIGGV